MNKKQLSEHIGNIDDRLVQQAEKNPNYAVQHRQKRLRQLLATAAALVLMIFGFAVGATAFAREIVVEVPVEQETLELEDVDLMLILPDKEQESLYQKMMTEIKEIQFVVNNIF